MLLKHTFLALAPTSVMIFTLKYQSIYLRSLCKCQRRVSSQNVKNGTLNYPISKPGSSLPW